MYSKVGEVDICTCNDILDIARQVKWKVIKGPDVDYRTNRNVDIEQKLIWPKQDIHSASFFGIPPGGEIKKHSDGHGRNQGIRGEYSTYHIPLETNDKCISRVWKNGVMTEQNLKVGSVYKINTILQHQSFNRGKTNRIHLVVEVYD